MLKGTTGQCSNIIGDCNYNSIPVGSYCYPFTSTALATCPTFTVSKFALPNNVTASLKTQNEWECIVEAAKLGKTVSGVRYDLDTGMCLMYGQNGKAVPSDPNKCYHAYTRDSFSGTGSNCVNIKQDEKTISINYAKPNETNKVPIIQSKNSGGNCRKEIFTDRLDPSVENDKVILKDMGEWCGDKSNEELQVCSDFCTDPTYNTYCQQSHFPTAMIVFIGLALLSLLVTLTLIVKRKRVYGYVGVSVTVIFTVLSIWKGVQGKNIYGNKPDYEQTKIPTFGVCIPTVFNYKCNSGDSDSNSCVVCEQGDEHPDCVANKWYTKSACDTYCSTCKQITQGPDGSGPHDRQWVQSGHGTGRCFCSCYGEDKYKCVQNSVFYDNIFMTRSQCLEGKDPIANPLCSAGGGDPISTC